jgi:hypothetical protein
VTSSGCHPARPEKPSLFICTHGCKRVARVYLQRLSFSVTRAWVFLLCQEEQGVYHVRDEPKHCLPPPGATTLWAPGRPSHVGVAVRRRWRPSWAALCPRCHLPTFTAGADLCQVAVASWTHPPPTRNTRSHCSSADMASGLRLQH